MMVLADKYQVPELLEYAHSRMRMFLKTEAEAFWPLAEMLDDLAEEVEGKVNKVLIEHARSNRPKYLGDLRFKKLMKSKHELAWEIIRNPQDVVSWDHEAGWGWS